MLLNKLLTDQTVACDVPAANWEEAVTKCGDLLVDAGFVEKRYVAAMIETVKQLGPYSVIAPGIALPHSRPEDGVVCNCMALIKLKEPVNFGSHNDPVYIVIAFGANEKESHITALKELAESLQENEFIEDLKKATCKEEIINLFSGCDETMVKIIINHEYCDGCGTCVRVCPNEIYELVEMKSVAKHPEKCIVCRECELQCPNNAITIEE